MRGAALTGMQRFAEARASYEEVLKRDPDNDAASYNLVELDLSQGAIDLARARLNEILARQPRGYQGRWHSLQVSPGATVTWTKRSASTSASAMVTLAR